MEACLETSTPPSVNPAPAWAMRVPRPLSDGFRMAEELQGVPKPVLQTVFGKTLGRRIWERVRPGTAEGAANPGVRIEDAEISVGMAGYVSRQAAHALREKGRLAKALTITIGYSDGSSHSARTRLPGPTNESDLIAAAAIQLLRRFPVRGVRSVNLAIAGVALTADREHSPALVHSLAGA